MTLEEVAADLTEIFRPGSLEITSGIVGDRIRIVVRPRGKGERCAIEIFQGLLLTNDLGWWNAAQHFQVDIHQKPSICRMKHRNTGFPVDIVFLED